MLSALTLLTIATCYAPEGEATAGSGSGDASPTPRARKRKDTGPGEATPPVPTNPLADLFRQNNLDAIAAGAVDVIQSEASAIYAREYAPLGLRGENAAKLRAKAEREALVIVCRDIARFINDGAHLSPETVFQKGRTAAVWAFSETICQSALSEKFEKLYDSLFD